MSIIVFTRPDGKPIAINSSQWHTVTEDIDGAKGHITQIGFSGTGSAIHVQDLYSDVIAKLEKADKSV
jgi:hypothetical protein